jgi:hypothetical protein
MANSYIENLNKLAQNNFMGGMVQSASAELMLARTKAATETLSNLNNELSALDSNIPLTTEEQISRLQDNPQAKQITEDISQRAAQFQAMSGKLRDRQQLYQNAYGKAITELGVIGGEEADRMLPYLEKQQQMKTISLENTRRDQMEQLEFESALMKEKTEKLEYQINYSNFIKTQDNQFLTDLIAQTQSFKALPKGKQILTNRKLYLEANKQLSNTSQGILFELKNNPEFLTYFKDKDVNEASMQSAIAFLMKQYNVELEYKQPEVNASMLRMEQAQRMQFSNQYNAYRSQLKALTNEYNSDPYRVNEFWRTVVPNLRSVIPNLSPEEAQTLYDSRTGKLNTGALEKYYITWVKNPLGAEESSKQYNDWRGKFSAGQLYEQVLNQYTGMFPMMNSGESYYAKDSDRTNKMKLNIANLQELDDKLKSTKDQSMVNLYNKLRTDLPRDLYGVPKDYDFMHTTRPGSLESGRDIDWNPAVIDKYKVAISSKEGLPGLQATVDLNMMQQLSAPSDEGQDDIINFFYSYPSYLNSVSVPNR